MIKVYFLACLPKPSTCCQATDNNQSSDEEKVEQNEESAETANVDSGVTNRAVIYDQDEL